MTTRYLTWLLWNWKLIYWYRAWGTIGGREEILIVLFLLLGKGLYINFCISPTKQRTSKTLKFTRRTRWFSLFFLSRLSSRSTRKYRWRSLRHCEKKWITGRAGSKYNWNPLTRVYESPINPQPSTRGTTSRINLASRLPRVSIFAFRLISHYYL